MGGIVSAVITDAVHRSQALRSVARRATFGRSLGLLRSFPQEQSDPDVFYSGLARDTVELVSDLWAESGDGAGTLPGLTVLDVGGGPGYFSDAYAAEGARYVSVEPDVGEMAAAGIAQAGSVRGSGMALPIRSDSVDICISSNVAEHVPEPWTMAEEMCRVTRPGGLVVVSYTLWYGPFGGHEMGLTHYLGGERARRMYERKHGHPPKNYYGESLFEVGCAEGLEWATGTRSGELLAAFPRYHPRWAWWLVRVPGLREVLVSNLVLVLRAR